MESFDNNAQKNADADDEKKRELVAHLLEGFKEQILSSFRDALTTEIEAQYASKLEKTAQVLACVQQERDDAVTEVMQLKNVAGENEELKMATKQLMEKLKDKDMRIADLYVKLEALQKDQQENEGGAQQRQLDIAYLNSSIHAQKKTAQEMSSRLKESKIKMQLLTDKMRENVEAIASFAEGNEFEEFRKKIHFDETIQKYEDEIKTLKLKNLELENDINRL